MLPSSSTAPSALRRPLCELRFGRAGADDWQRALVWVRIRVGLAPFVDVAEVGLAGGDWAPQAAVGDTGSIQLGYEDSGAELVFTGQVQALRSTLEGGLVVTAVNAGGLLARLRLNQAYEQMKAGDIARDLAGRAEASAGNLQDGIDLPYYVLDDRRSAYAHIAILARKCGFQAYIAPDGKLAFGPLTPGQAAGSFVYGVDLLHLEAQDGQAPGGAVTAIGQGAASTQGKEAWSWLVKDPAQVSASAGDGNPERQAPDPALRSAAAAQAASRGAADVAGLFKLTGRLVAPGAPAVAVGSTIEVRDAPLPGLDGSLLARDVQHVYTKHAGFTTWIEFGPAGGGLGGLL